MLEEKSYQDAGFIKWTSESHLVVFKLIFGYETQFLKDASKTGFLFA